MSTLSLPAVLVPSSHVRRIGRTDRTVDAQRCVSIGKQRVVEQAALGVATELTRCGNAQVGVFSHRQQIATAPQVADVGAASVVLRHGTFRTVHCVRALNADKRVDDARSARTRTRCF